MVGYKYFHSFQYMVFSRECQSHFCFPLANRGLLSCSVTSTFARLANNVNTITNWISVFAYLRSLIYFSSQNPDYPLSIILDNEAFENWYKYDQHFRKLLRNNQLELLVEIILNYQKFYSQRICKDKKWAENNNAS